MTQFATNVPPGEVDSATAERALKRVQSYLERHHDAELTLHVEAGTDDERLVVPRVAVQMFAQTLAFMARGEGVVVVPKHKRLTTQEAADLLNVSRPYLIKLLEQGEIPFEKVNRHRRVRLDDLLTYKRAAKKQQIAAADELSKLGQELGT